jgi:hypothetical protein
MGPDIIIVRDLNISFSSIEHPEKKINKNILELNNTMVKMNLTNIYRVFHPVPEDYRFFLVTHGTFS